MASLNQLTYEMDQWIKKKLLAYDKIRHISFHTNLR